MKRFAFVLLALFCGTMAFAGVQSKFSAVMSNPADPFADISRVQFPPNVSSAENKIYYCLKEMRGGINSLNYNLDAFHSQFISPVKQQGYQYLGRHNNLLKGISEHFDRTNITAQYELLLSLDNELQVLFFALVSPEASTITKLFPLQRTTTDFLLKNAPSKDAGTVKAVFDRHAELWGIACSSDDFRTFGIIGDLLLYEREASGRKKRLSAKRMEQVIRSSRSAVPGPFGKYYTEYCALKKEKTDADRNYINVTADMIEAVFPEKNVSQKSAGCGFTVGRIEVKDSAEGNEKSGRIIVSGETFNETALNESGDFIVRIYNTSNEPAGSAKFNVDSLPTGQSRTFWFEIAGIPSSDIGGILIDCK